MHAKAAQHGLRVFRFDENPPKLPLSQSRLKYHHGSSWCWVPGRPRILLRTKKSSFSPQDLHGLWGGGLQLSPSNFRFQKLIISNPGTNPPIPQCLVNLVAVLQTLMGFSRANHCFLLIKLRVSADIIMYMYYFSGIA